MNPVSVVSLFSLLFHNFHRYCQTQKSIVAIVAPNNSVENLKTIAIKGIFAQ